MLLVAVPGAHGMCQADRLQSQYSAVRLGEHMSKTGATEPTRDDVPQCLHSFLLSYTGPAGTMIFVSMLQIRLEASFQRCAVCKFAAGRFKWSPCTCSGTGHTNCWDPHMLAIQAAWLTKALLHRLSLMHPHQRRAQWGPVQTSA